MACVILSSVKPREEPLKRSLSNLVVDFSGSLLLQDRVALHSEDVVGASDSETFMEESKVCQWLPTLLDTFVHGSSDVCLGQELVCNELSVSCSDSECVVLPAVTVETLFMFSTSSILCTQVHVINDFRFLWVPLRSDFGVGDVEFLQEGT